MTGTARSAGRKGLVRREGFGQRGSAPAWTGSKNSRAKRCLKLIVMFNRFEDPQQVLGN
jgi:hypothetical protein